VISVVVLQNQIDLLEGELGSCTETSDITEEDEQERMTVPVIKTEPKVSCVCTFPIGCTQNCLPLYQSVLVKQKFDSREWILSSF
jgi:hypothetical protein